MNEDKGKSNVQEVAEGAGIVAGYVAGGVLGAVAGKVIAKPVYEVAKEIPIVGDVLGVLEDIFG